MLGDVTTDKCIPFASTTPAAGGCQSLCADGSAPPQAGGVVAGSYAMLQTAANIKAELVANGPLAIAITVPTSFLTYFPLSGGTPGTDPPILPVTNTMRFLNPGGHMMTLLGYDDTTTPPCWIIQNSWGYTQGNKGVIRLGQDTQGLLTNSVPWVDTHGYTAQVRTAATDPVAVVTNLANTAAANAGQQLTKLSPGTQPRIFTASVTCPNMVLNYNASNASAAIQGCPNSAANVHLSAAGALRPPAALILFIILLALFAYS
jgi:hypothetical protein